MRWRRKTEPAATVALPESLWHDVIGLVSALDERDRARDIAVALEGENAHLVNLLRALAHDLRHMHAVGAVDVHQWPNAAAITEWLEAQP